MSESTATLPRRGRPRDPRVEGKVLAAAGDVVAEVGLRNVTMSAIADRAGCGKPTIYLRWPNVQAVVVAALGALDVDEADARLAHDACLFLRTLRDRPDGAFLAEVASVSDGVDVWAALGWGAG